MRLRYGTDLWNKKALFRQGRGLVPYIVNFASLPQSPFRKLRHHFNALVKPWVQFQLTSVRTCWHYRPNRLDIVIVTYWIKIETSETDTQDFEIYSIDSWIGTITSLTLAAVSAVAVDGQFSHSTKWQPRRLRNWHERRFVDFLGLFGHSANNIINKWL